MDLKPLFEPRSIALVGASAKPGKVGNAVFRNLQNGFRGKLYPVNPTATDIGGLKCYPDIKSLPEAVDIAVVAVPAAQVPGVLKEAMDRGVASAIVISAGFKEAGHPELEQEIVSVMRAAGRPLIGPNCLGLADSATGLNASFLSLLPPPGDVAFISQSGAICSSIIDCAKERGIGFSKFVSIGNKAVVSELEVLAYLKDDPATKVIGLYVENIDSGRELLNVVRGVTTGPKAKPVVILKAGRTAKGAAAAASHTGAIANDDDAYLAFIRQSGATSADTLSDLFGYIQTFSQNAHAAARRIAVITNAGGPGVVTADCINRMTAVDLAPLTDETQAALRAALPPAASAHNPIDVLGDADSTRYAKALDLAIADKNVDSVLLISTPQSMTDVDNVARVVVEAHHRSPKPMAAALIGAEQVAAGRRLLVEGKTPSFDFPEEGVRGLAALQTYFINRERGPIAAGDRKPPAAARAIIDKAKAEGRDALVEAEAQQLLAAYGFPLLPTRFATNADEAASSGRELGKPLAIKIVSPDILHKSDAGGVELNVPPEKAGEAFNKLMERVRAKRPEAKLEGVLMAPMAPKGGAEMILGAKKDASFGHVLLVGWGGIYVEVVKDTAVGLAPITAAEAAELVDSLKVAKIIAGARGGAGLDRAALIAAIVAMSDLVMDFPDVIKEIDANPFLLLPPGQPSMLLDARVILG